MKKAWLALLFAAAVAAAGCSGGAPKAVAPETQVDFGDVLTTNNMNDAKLKEFFIQNAGTGDLKISEVQVKLLQGC